MPRLLIVWKRRCVPHDSLGVTIGRRNLHARLARIEQKNRNERLARDNGHRMLMQRIGCAQLACQPNLTLVTADDTDPETFRSISSTVAWAKAEFDRAERLEAEEPDDGLAGFPKDAKGDTAEVQRRSNNASVKDATRRQRLVHQAIAAALERLGMGGGKGRKAG